MVSLRTSIVSVNIYSGCRLQDLDNKYRHLVEDCMNEIRADHREYLNTAEVAELARTTDSTVRYWRHIGYGPQGFVVGRRVLYKASDVHAWLQRLYADAGGAARDERG